MGERCPVSVREDWRLAASIIRDVMGDYHAYYAAWAARSGGGLVARACGRPAGSVVYYRAELPEAVLGVVYYVAVRPQFRGLGLGRILVASAEEVMEGSDAYVATTTDDNIASQKLFRSLGYTVEAWEGLESRLGPAATEAIYLSTCAYEDDIVMTREEKPGALRAITAESLEEAQRHWDNLCLRPYLLRRTRPTLHPILGAGHAP